VDGADTRVERDGPALRIARPGRAERWFPLRVLSQVVSAERVEWATDALLACAGQGITVSFLDEDGTVLARLLGKPGERMELPQRLADFLLRPDWPARYDAWQAAMERMAVRSVARRAGLGWSQPPTGRDLRRLFRDGAESLGSLEPFEHIGGEVHGLTEALATQHLAEAGIVGDFDGGDGLDLAADFSRILYWDFKLARLAWLEDRLRDDRADLPGREEIVGFFEARRPRTERLAAGLLNRLHRWLVELD
jgi:hypothetical protein